MPLGVSRFAISAEKGATVAEYLSVVERIRRFVDVCCVARVPLKGLNLDDDIELRWALGEQQATKVPDIHPTGALFPIAQSRENIGAALKSWIEAPEARQLGRSLAFVVANRAELMIAGLG